jgi:WW domain
MSPAPEDTTNSKTLVSEQILEPRSSVNVVEELNTESSSTKNKPALKAATKRKRGTSEDIEEQNKIELDKNEEEAARHKTSEPLQTNGTIDVPTLPEGEVPPLPDEAPPALAPEQDDGWAPVWEETAQAYYFYNRFTGATQWTNPRVPEASQIPASSPNVSIPIIATPDETATAPRPAGGYDPSIHGDYDPNAWYAQQPDTTDASTGADASTTYAATGAFNRFTGRWQAADLTPENFSDENKSRRQMNAFFDVDAAANSHDGRSLKAERSGKKLSKSELKQFKEKRKAKKEEKRRAWLRD